MRLGERSITLRPPSLGPRRLLRMGPPSEKPPWRTLYYSLPVSVTAVAAVDGLHITWPALFAHGHVFLYVAAVAVASRFGGFCAGLEATLLSAGSLAALDHLGVELQTVVGQVRFAVFLGVDLMISYLNGVLWEQIRERESARRIREELHAELERRVADLEEFSHTVAHDLRAPLRAIEGYARILDRRFKGRISAEDQILLERIRQAVLGMDGLILDVLSFSRAARDMGELDSIELERALREVIGRYPRLWEAAIDVRSPLGRVQANGGLLTQILGNLLDNAVKFVPDSRRPEVLVFVSRADGRIRLHVRDNGIGIAPGDRDRVFRPFEKASAPMGREGRGIGLAIVKKAAERMGGRVGVESQPGKGSEFWVELKEAA